MSVQAKTTRVTSKGQVTIPKRMRDAKGLTPGKLVTFDTRGEGVLILPAGKRPKSVFEKWQGRLRGGMTTDEVLAITRGE